MTQTLSNKIYEYIDKIINPICLLELRSTLRTNRFLITFLIALLISIGGVIFTLLVFISSSSTSPSQIGKGLFLIFFFFEYAIVVLFFPAFTCTSICSEKERKTFDLLLSTNLNPAQIIQGKFLAAFIYAFLFIIATLPLSMIALLFGGISILLVFISYIILFCCASIFIMFALWCSCFNKTITRSIITSYAINCTIGFFLSLALGALLTNYLYDKEILLFFSKGWGINQIMAVVSPIVVYIIVLLFPYLLSIFHFKTDYASIGLRIYFFASILLLVILASIWYIYNSIITIQTYTSKYSTALGESPYVFLIMGSITITVLLLIGAIGFPLETKVGKLLHKKQANSIKARFTPGAINSCILVIITATLALGLIVIAIFLGTKSFNLNYFRNNRDFKVPHCFVLGPLVFWSFICFITILTTYLSLKIQRFKLAKFATVSVVIVLAAVIPLYMAIVLAVDDYSATIYDFSYLSPVLNYWSALANHRRLGDINFKIHGFIPIHYVGIVTYVVASLVLFGKSIVLHKQEMQKIKKKEDELMVLKQSMDRGRQAS